MLRLLLRASGAQLHHGRELNTSTEGLTTGPTKRMNLCTAVNEALHIAMDNNPRYGANQGGAIKLCATLVVSGRDTATAIR
jgi:hypothetical protein